MIWLILSLAIVGGIGAFIGLWLSRQMPTDQAVSPIQNGTLYKEFRENIDIDRPKPESYEE